MGLQSTPARAMDFDKIAALSTKVVLSLAALTAIAYYYIFYGNEGAQ